MTDRPVAPPFAPTPRRSPSARATTPGHLGCAPFPDDSADNGGRDLARYLRVLAVPSHGYPQHDGAERPRPAGSGSPDELLARLVEQPWSGVEIDPTLAPLVCTGITGTAGTLVEVRHQLERWAARAGLPTATMADLVLASYEALANAAEHAYPGESGPIDLVAARTADGRVLITVVDHGQWRPPPPKPGYRGRGLQMIKALSHRSQIQPGTHGTTVHMEWALPAPD